MRSIDLVRRLAAVLLRPRAASSGLMTLACWIVASSLAGWVAAHLFTSAYGQNDDAAIQSVLSGELSGKPSSLVPFVSPVLGEFLARAYRLSPDVPWFGLLVAATGLAACGALVASVALINRAQRSLEPAVTAVMIAPISAWVALQPTFTVSAVLCGAASVVLLAASIGRSRAPRDPSLVVAALMFAIVGLALRPPAGLLGMLAAAPALALAVYAQRREPRVRHEAVRALAVLAAAGAVIAGPSVVLDSYRQSSSPAWSAFSAFNDARGALHQTPSGDALGSRVSAAGWSQDEFRLFDTFALLDPKTPSLEKLQSALSVTADVRGLTPLLSSAAWQRLGADTNALISMAAYWLLAAAVVLVVLLVGRSIPLAVTGLVICVAWGMSWVVLVGLWQRAPARLAIPVMAACLVAAAVTIAAVPLPRTGALHPRRRLLTAGLLVGVVCLSAATLLRDPLGVFPLSRSNADARSWQERQLAALSTLDLGGARGVIVTPSALVTIANPYESAPVFPRAGVPLGWLSFSPDWNHRVRALGLRPQDLLADLTAGRALLATGASTGQEESVARIASQRVRYRVAPCGRGIVWALCRAE
jgi:hypothetical protein